MTLRALLSLLVVIAAALPAAAHLGDGTKPRTILIAQGPDGLVAYVRTPAPLLYAADIAEAQARQVRFEAEFLETRRVGAAIAFLISQDAIAAAPEAFSRRLARSLDWRQYGRPVAVTAVRWRLHADLPADQILSPAQARRALDGPPPAEDPTFGAAYVDYELHLAAAVPAGDLRLRSAHPVLPLPPGVEIDNHLLQHRGDRASSTAVAGQLQDWASVDGAPWQAATFVVIGARAVLWSVPLMLAAVLAGVATARIGPLQIVPGFFAAQLVALGTGAILTLPAWLSWIAAPIAVALAMGVARRWAGLPWIAAATGGAAGLTLSAGFWALVAPDSAFVAPALPAFALGALGVQGLLAAGGILAAGAVRRAAREEPARA